MRLQRHILALMRWSALGMMVGVLAGAATAAFLYLLERATSFRTAHESLVYALPLAGLVIGYLYERFGSTISGGHNLVIDTIVEGGPELPVRMAPMVLVGTVLTHLFGGSAGREGTAVQMGASLSDWLSHRLRVDHATRRILLATGAAGGFGAVFGTPIAGTIFGLEFVVRGRIDYRALLPALLAALTGDYLVRSVGIVHIPFPHPPPLELTPLVLGKWVLFAAAVAIVAAVFIELTHALKRFGQFRFPRLPIRMFVFGAVIVGLWQLSGTSEFLGLGVPTIVRAFEDPSLPASTFALKLLFTAVTLGAGFLGGEVTPLFFIGAALGNLLAAPLGLPLELAAAVGLSGVFSTAAKTPLALSIMAGELFGAQVLPHIAIVAVLAYAASGERSIYAAQRTAHEPPP